MDTVVTSGRIAPGISVFHSLSNGDGGEISSTDTAFCPEQSKFPAIKEVIEEVDKFAAAPSNNKKREVQEAKTVELLAHPASYVAFFSALEELERRIGAADPAVGEYKEFLDKYLKFYAGAVRLDHNAFAIWLTQLTYDTEFANTARLAIKCSFEKLSDEDQIVNFLYELSLAVAECDDPKVRAFGTKLICFGTELIPLNSEQHKIFHISTFAHSDDTLLKHIEIISAQDYLGRQYAKEEIARLEEANEILGSGEDKFVRREAIKRHRCQRDRVEAIRDFFRTSHAEENDELNLSRPSIDSLDSWPLSLVLRNSGPLRCAIHERLAKDNPNIIALWLPTTGSNILDDLDKAPAIVYSELKRSEPSGETYTRRDALVALYYLTPIFRPEDREKLIRLTLGIRNDIRMNYTRFVSSRGDLMKVQDPNLIELGYQSILFKAGKPVTTTVTTVDVRGHKYKFEIDADFNFRELGGNHDILVPAPKRGFFEHVVLSHLKVLLCSKLRENARNSRRRRHTGNGHEQSNSKIRESHFRYLPEGACYTEEQRRLCLEVRGEKLEDINRIRKRTKETGQVTFVKAIEPDGEYEETLQEPYQLSAPDAMSQLWKDLGITYRK